MFPVFLFYSRECTSLVRTRRRAPSRDAIFNAAACNTPETFPALFFFDELFHSGFLFRRFLVCFCVNAAPSFCVCVQLLRSSLVNNRTQAKVAEELGMQEFAITNDKTKRPVVLRTKTLADLLECMLTAFEKQTKKTSFPDPNLTFLVRF